MELDDLRGDMTRQFEAVGRQFEQIGQRFEAVDRRFEAVDQRFEAVDQRFDAVDRRFDAVDRRFEEVLSVIRSLFDQTHRFVVEEGERTRRYFDVVVEQIKSERNLAIDKAMAVDERTGRLTASNAADHVEFSVRLDAHEIRLTRLEQKDDDV